MTKPKVLFLFYQTSRKANGGVNSLMEIILGMQQVIPHVVTNRESSATKQLRAKGIPVDLLPWPEGGRVQRVIGIMQSIRLLQRYLKHHSVEVAHVNDIQTLTFSAWVLGKNKIPVVFNIRDVLPPERKYSFIWRLVNRCARVVVLSHAMKEALINRLPLNNKRQWKDRFHVIYSIVDQERFFPRPNRQEKALLYAATFNDKKNQKGFIEQALPKLASEGYFVHFTGDTDNPYGHQCMKMVNDLGLQNNVAFHGFQADMQTWYNRVRLTLVPTRREGLARCMIESLACGTPVVSFDVPSAHEILTEYESGVVLNQGNYTGMVEAIVALDMNEDHYTRMSQNGLDVSSRLFKREGIVSSYEFIYRKLCST